MINIILNKRIIRNCNVLNYNQYITNFSSISNIVSNDNLSVNESDSNSNNDSKPEKNIRHNKENLQKLQPQNIYDAIDIVKKSNWAKFDESVEIIVNLGVDPRKPNQAIKGVAKLPHGVGKIVRVAVFAQGSDVQAAKDAGADAVGSDELVARVQAGDFPFDSVIATPEMMPTLGKIGKLLGPKGLMPNPKMGTVTKDVAKAVKASKAGAVQFRVEKKGIIQACIGKVSFTKEKLLENIRSMMVAIGDSKPEGIKGKYYLVGHIKSTMGRSIPIDVATIDPTNGRFMLDPTKVTVQT